MHTHLVVFEEQHVLRQLEQTLHVNINYLVHVAITVLEQAFIVSICSIRRFGIEFACNVCIVIAWPPCTIKYFFF